MKSNLLCEVIIRRLIACVAKEDQRLSDNGPMDPPTNYVLTSIKSKNRCRNQVESIKL